MEIDIGDMNCNFSVACRLQTYDIKDNKSLHQQSLKEIHTLALNVIFSKRISETARIRQKNLKTYLAQLPKILRESLRNDVLPKCLLCRELLAEAEKEFCINSNDDLDHYIFILKSPISMSGNCVLRVKEHMFCIAFDY